MTHPTSVIDDPRPLLKVGETVFLVSGWRKRHEAGQDPILHIQLHLVHGDYAKIGDHYYALDKDFFRVRSQAIAHFRSMIGKQRKALETSYKRKCSQLDELLAVEAKRLAR